MEYSSADNLLSDIKSGQILPVYVLHGVEPFFIDKVTSHMEKKLLSEGEQAFNQSVLYGRDVDSKQVLDYARQYPMMAERRVVIIKEAQGMRDLKSLGSYISSPSPQTVLVIAHKKKIDGRIKWVKEAKKSDQIGMMSSDPVQEYKLNAWITSYVKSQKLKMTGDAVEMLSQYLGTDLKKITNEIEKIKVNLDAGELVDIPQIEKYIGISRDYDIYALLNALSRGDTPRVHEITYNIEANVKVQPLQMIIPGMATYFEKVLVVAQNFKKDDRTLGSMIGSYGSYVKEYRDMAKRYGYSGLIKIYKMLLQADAQSKGFERRKGDGILKELVGKILLFQRVPSNQ